MPLPQPVRRLAPDRLRYSVRLRALAVGSGLVPPRSMHSPAESQLLADLARDRSTAVEIGVYEGSSAVVLAGALPATGALHLIDPFGESSTLLPGWAGVEGATRRVVARAARRRPDGGPHLIWHVERSEDAAATWREPVDLVFIDGDHSEAGCRLDWELWNPFVASGGVVVFHDATGSDALPGPKAVVDGLFGGDRAPPGWRIAAEVDSAVVAERLDGA
jgi:predicted O-methyltransferase YrrM